MSGTKSLQIANHWCGVVERILGGFFHTLLLILFLSRISWVASGHLIFQLQDGGLCLEKMKVISNPKILLLKKNTGDYHHTGCIHYIILDGNKTQWEPFHYFRDQRYWQMFLFFIFFVQIQLGALLLEKLNKLPLLLYVPLLSLQCIHVHWEFISSSFAVFHKPFENVGQRHKTHWVACVLLVFTSIYIFIFIFIFSTIHLFNTFIEYLVCVRHKGYSNSLGWAVQHCTQ